MGNFEKNFKEFLHNVNKWDNPEENEVIDYLRKNAKEIINSGDGMNMINSFIDANKYIMYFVSPDFLKQLTGLESDFLNESDAGFDGYWEETALLIYNRSKVPNSHLPINVNIVRRIKELAKEYGTIIQSTDTQQDHLVLPRIQISQIIEFEKDLKSIDKNLRTKLHTTNRNFNIADKINNGLISENKNTMDKNIRVGLTNWKIKVNDKRIIVTEGKNNYEPFINENGQVVWDTPALIPFVIKESVSEISRQLKENDSADINVPELPLTSSESLNRVSRFDPYGNAQNRQAGSKTMQQFDKLTFKESVSKLDINKVYIIDNDLSEDTGMYSNLLIEHRGKLKHIVIDKKDFSNFVKRNCNVSGFLTESGFNFPKYFSTRTSGYVNTIIKEYFEKQNDDSNELNIERVLRDNGDITIVYYYDQENDSKELSIPEEEFFTFCQKEDNNIDDYVVEKEDADDDHPMGFGIEFDENAYWENGPIDMMAEKFLRNNLNK